MSPASASILQDRADAGRRLARLLEPYRDAHPLILALPRGGVPVAAVVATALGAPLDILVVRKLGIPGHPEFGFGAIGEDGVLVLDQGTTTALGLTRSEIAHVHATEQAELERRLAHYRQAAPALELADQMVIIVDDGLATGGTMLAAIAVARAKGAASVILAVPVAAPQALARIGTEADQVICVLQPANFEAVGKWYLDFAETSDAQVVDLLAANRHPHPSPNSRGLLHPARSPRP